MSDEQIKIGTPQELFDEFNQIKDKYNLTPLDILTGNTGKAAAIIESMRTSTLLVIANDDQPGVIGEVGTILGRMGVNIASFALGRGDGGAVGVVNVDADTTPIQQLDAAVQAIRRAPHVRDAWLVRLNGHV